MGKLDVIWNPLSSFQKDEIEKLPDNVPGIFRLSYRHEDKSTYVFYVGKAADVKASLNELLQGKNTTDTVAFFVTHRTCFFRWAKLDGEENRNSAQRQLYKFYQPVGNAELPEGDDSITINVT